MVFHNGPNPTREQIHEELTSEFVYFEQAKADEFLHECVEIALFLSNVNRVESALVALEKELAAKVGQHLDRLVAHYRDKASGKHAPLDAELKHLVSQELTGMEIRSGFSGFTAAGYKHGQKVQTYTRFVKPKAFLEEVRLGRHWKDPTVPGLHGEYSHRLQWYLVGKQLSGVIKRTLVDVFSQTAIVDHKGDFEYGLWYALFDRDNGSDTSAPFKVASGGCVDSRSPERLTLFITDDANAQKLPILHWFIKSRLLKRQRSPLNNYWKMLEYVDEKLKKHGLQIDAKAVVGPKQGRDGGQIGGTGVLRSGDEIPPRR